MSSKSPKEPLPYWLVNVPKSQWPSECPAFLADQSQRNRDLLSIPDTEYKLQTWDEIKEIIQNNDLQRFQRVPSELRRYLEFLAELKAIWGSVMQFVLTRRLGWTSTDPAGRPFEHAHDSKVLYNDWPYGFEPKIKHLVVWVKFALEEDPATGDLTHEARTLIQTYIDSTFGQRLPRERIAWFRNWSAIKSIHAIEHIHVLLVDPEPAELARLTNGDVAIADLSPEESKRILSKS